jgi:hypothetical protein
MKTICAWCGGTISVQCSHCSAPLIAATAIGGTFGFFGDAMVCLNGETPEIYSRQVIERMPVSHGLCDRCRELPKETRDALLIERRKHDRAIPNEGALEEIVRETTAAQDHERETRAHQTAHQKRGPMGVSREPTTTPQPNPKKGGTP